MQDAVKILGFFLVPFGGGVPSGVLFAKTHGFGFSSTSFIYLVSDLILALAFEPFVKLVALVATRSFRLRHLLLVTREFTWRSIERVGLKSGPFSLIAISLAIDPMTGRTAGLAAGYGVISSWVWAIAGDMINFSILMLSTIWLEGILGDGTLAVLIVVGLMLAVPPLIRRLRALKA